MGGQRQPVDLVMLNGNKHLTKAEIAERKASEVKAPSDKVRAPSYLSKDLKKEFNKISKQLLNIEIMTNLDVDILAMFVQARKQYLDVTEAIMQTSPYHKVESENGPELESNKSYLDLVNAQDKFFKQCRQSAADLGLTISSRCKLVVPKKQGDKPKNKFEKFM